MKPYLILGRMKRQRESLQEHLALRQPFPSHKKLRDGTQTRSHETRMRHYTRIVWIDAVCINQDDIGERGHQVGLMPQIYSGAKTVLMYIGEVSLFPPTVQKMSVQSVLDVELTIPPSYWTEMLSSRYFTRLWVLQEVALARKAILMCGEQSFPWNLVREKAKCMGSG